MWFRIATDRKFLHQFAIGEKLKLFKHILLLLNLVSNRVIVIKNRQKIFQLQFQLLKILNNNYNYSKAV